MHNIKYWKYEKRSKYGNKTTYYNGYNYHSKFEANYAQELDLRLKAGEIKSWQRQVKMSLDVNGKHICNYYIDFLVIHSDDEREYVEVKGFATDLWRIKWRLLEALIDEIDPGASLTIVK